jgi:sulfonate transport system permease protein
MSSIDQVAASPVQIADRIQTVVPIQPLRAVTKVGRDRFLGLLSWLAPFLLVTMWEGFARFGGLSPQILPAPSKIVVTAVKLAINGTLVADMTISLLRAATGFAVGGSIGFALGTAVGFSRIAEALFDRSIQMVRAIPFLALLPLVIVWFGVGEAEKIFLVSLGVSFPIYINTTLGIRQVDPKLIELGRVWDSVEAS